MAKQLSETPTVHETARVADSTLGRWTEVGARTTIVESTMDDYSYIVNDGNVIYTTIGKFCSIAAQVRLNPGNHPTWRASQHHFSYRAAAYDLGEDDAEFFQWRRAHAVSIGNDVWICHGALVMPGVRVGTGAIIASAAVVTKDVDPYTVVAGVPAKPIKRRFPKDLADKLMDLEWWNWSHQQLRDRLGDFQTLTTEAFVEKWS